MSQQRATQTETTDEFIITLESDGQFYRDWYTLAQSFLCGFFNTNDIRRSGRVFKEVRHNYPDPVAYFSTFCGYDSILRDVRALIERSAQRLSVCEPVNSDDASARYFSCSLVMAIQSGEIKLPEAEQQALVALYASGNIAKTCRELGMKPHAAKKLMCRMPKSDHERYTAVQGGRAYSAVMGDCEGFMHNHPLFMPELLVKESSSQQAEPGDLVCSQGSSHWFEVASALDSSIRTSMPDNAEFSELYISKPFYLVKKQYVSQAIRFSHSINKMPTAAFLARAGQ